MAKKYYLLEAATADNICVHEGLVGEGASADKTINALHAKRLECCAPLNNLSDEWNADAYFSNVTGRFYGFKFREEPSEDIKAIFRKPNREGITTLRAKPPKKNLRDIHSQYTDAYKEAVKKHSEHWITKDNIIMFNVVGLSHFDFVFSGGGLHRGEKDKEAWCLISEVPPKTMTFRELTVSEFEAL